MDIANINWGIVLSAAAAVMAAAMAGIGSAVGVGMAGQAAAGAEQEENGRWVHGRQPREGRIVWIIIRRW